MPKYLDSMSNNQWYANHRTFMYPLVHLVFLTEKHLTGTYYTGRTPAILSLIFRFFFSVHNINWWRTYNFFFYHLCNIFGGQSCTIHECSWWPPCCAPLVYRVSHAVHIIMLPLGFYPMKPRFYSYPTVVLWIVILLYPYPNAGIADVFVELPG